MELTNRFEVSVPIEEAWAVLTDVERIAPCLPGAQLQEVEGDEYRGIVKVKVGPIMAQYKGKASFVELDAEDHRAVLTASGRDTRGQGNANATITAELAPREGHTQVSVLTDLRLTGKVAQFGRGVLSDVSANLLDQFVDNLEGTLGAGPADQTTAPDQAVPEDQLPEDRRSDEALSDAQLPADEPAVRRVDHPEPEPVDLIEHAGTPVLQRLVPVVAVGIVALFVLWLIRRCRS